MATHLVNGVNALGESHVELLPAHHVSFLDHLDEHSLESLIAALDASNLLWAFQRCRVDTDSLLGHRHSEDPTVM